MLTMEVKRKKIVEPYDLWNDGEERITRSSTKLHPSLKRNRKNPLPHPGQSYNPDPEDHQKLLEKVARKELEHVKKQKSLKKALDVKVNRKELVKDAENELLAGIKHLIKDERSYDSEGSATDGAYSDYDEKDFAVICKDKKVVEKRKSRQQRIKQMKDRLQRKAAKLRKLKNIRLSKIDAIKKITKELEKKEKEQALKKRIHHKKIKKERFCQKLEESDPIYCLSSELPSNLRKVSCPMDAIVREQLENFQSRLMVEPTNFLSRTRKFKKREFERKAAAEQEG